MSTNQGAFVWYELLTTDVEAAKAFYSELIGWKQQAWEGSNYTMFAAGERPVAGVLELSEEQRKAGTRPHWLAHVATDDVAATTEAVVAAGGRLLVPPHEMPEVGQWAIVADPQGASFAAFKPAYADERGGEPQVGDVCWRELATSDFRAAWTFYEQLFGWTHDQDMEMGPLGTYRMFRAGAHQGGGMFNKVPDRPPAHWLYYFSVSDLDGAAARCLDLQGQVLKGPLEIPGGDRIVQCLDAQGAAFALHWRKQG